LAAAEDGVGKADESYLNYREAIEVGITLEKKRRALRQSGFDYLVEWEDNGKRTLHLPMHLTMMLPK
jgi:ribosomal protein L13E